MAASDVHPGSDLLHGIGRPATRALLEVEIDTVEKVSQHSEKDLLALHGVGPKAVRILRETLAEQGLAFRDP